MSYVKKVIKNHMLLLHVLNMRVLIKRTLFKKAHFVDLLFFGVDVSHKRTK